MRMTDIFSRDWVHLPCLRTTVFYLVALWQYTNLSHEWICCSCIKISGTQSKKLSVQNELQHCVKPSSWFVSFTPAAKTQTANNTIVTRGAPEPWGQWGQLPPLPLLHGGRKMPFCDVRKLEYWLTELRPSELNNINYYSAVYLLML